MLCEKEEYQIMLGKICLIQTDKTIIVLIRFGSKDSPLSFCYSKGCSHSEEILNTPDTKLLH